MKVSWLPYLSSWILKFLTKNNSKDPILENPQYIFLYYSVQSTAVPRWIEMTRDHRVRFSCGYIPCIFAWKNFSPFERQLHVVRSIVKQYRARLMINKQISKSFFFRTGRTSWGYGASTRTLSAGAARTWPSTASTSRAASRSSVPPTPAYSTSGIQR